MMYAYVGCRTTKERNARGEGLKTYAIQPSGEWKELQCLATEPNPSFQTLDNEGKFLYSVHGDFTKVTSYRVLPDHTLEYMNTVDIGGKNPVDITVDKENRHVIVATLQGGSLYTIARNADGPARYLPFTSACGIKTKTFCLPRPRGASMATASSARCATTTPRAGLSRFRSLWPAPGMSPAMLLCTPITAGCICVRKKATRCCIFSLIPKAAKWKPCRS